MIGSVKRLAIFVAAATFFFVVSALSTQAIASVTCLEAVSLSQTPWFSEIKSRLTVQGYEASSPTVCISAALTGLIKRGDADDLRDMIARNTPFIRRLRLDSPGGDVQEALKLGWLVRHHYLTVEAPLSLYGNVGFFEGKQFARMPEARCLSACFFVWLGGTYRAGNLVGYHRPYPPDEQMRGLTPSAAAEVYRNLSLTISTYLSEVEVAPHWLTDMLRVGSNDMHMLDDGEQRELSGDVPSMAQWKSARCGGLSEQEQHDLYEMTSLAFDGKLAGNLIQYRNALDKKSSDALKCEYEELIIARWQVRVH